MSPLAGIRLVALDLDGTLLPSTKVLPPRARDLTAALREVGIDVLLATGKGWSLTERYALEMGVTAPCVALEGALVRVPGGAAVRRLTVSADVRRRVAASVDGLSLSWFFTEDGSRIHASACLADATHLLQIWDPDVVLTEASLDTGTLGAAHVLHLLGTAEQVDGAHDRLRTARLDDEVELFRAEFWGGVHQIQVRPRGIGKHTALGHVLASRGIDASALLACGDWWNDLEMVRAAAVGVAPSDAVPAVREAADHVVPGTSDDEAILRFLEDALRTL